MSNVKSSPKPNLSQGVLYLHLMSHDLSRLWLWLKVKTKVGIDVVLTSHRDHRLGISKCIISFILFLFPAVFLMRM